MAFGVSIGIRELQKLKKIDNLLVVNPIEAKELEFPPGHPKKGEAEYNQNRKKAENLLFEATLTGNNEPEIPENLAWYNHEPTWQQIANGRINHGLKEFSLVVSYEDDFGVNAGLKK